MSPAEQLLAALFRELDAGEVIELRTFRGVESGTGRWWLTTPHDVDNVAKPGMSDLYFGVNPRRVPREGRRSGRNVDVSRILTFIADVDGVKRADAAVTPYGLQPSAVVRSGGGFHLYWFLDAPAENTVELTELRKQFVKLGTSDAVHDAARILRVPGTANTKYEGDPLVELVSLAPNLRYPIWMFEALLDIPVKVRRLLYTADVKGFESRSERDWHIVQSLIVAGLEDDEISTLLYVVPAGDRYRERWPNLVQYDLRQMRKLGPPSGKGITMHNNCYWANTSRGPKKLSTFTLEPTALLEGLVDEGDQVVCDIRAEGTDHVWRGVNIPKNAFIDRRSMNRHLKIAAWSWLGSDSEVIALLPYLMQTIQQKGVPVLRAITALGRYGMTWVGPETVVRPNDVVSFGEAGFAYLDTRREKPIVNYDIASEEELSELVPQVFDLLLRVNAPNTIMLIAGWFFAAAYKPILGPFGREFPILQVVGTHGAGKTSTIRNIFQPLTGYTESAGYTCDTTDFVLLSLMSSTTSIPIAFAEFRSSLPSIGRFLRRLRLTYDTGYDARGRPNQTTVSYILSAPVCIDGEMYTDDPALLERSVIATLHPEDLTDERREAFAQLSSLPLQRIAGAYVQWTLRNDPEMELANSMVKRVHPKRLPDRVRKNAEKVTCGYLAMQGFVSQYCEFPELTPELLKTVLNPWLDTILLAGTGRTAVLADSFIEDVINQVVSAGIGHRLTRGTAVTGSSPFVWRYDVDKGQLGFHLSTTLNWWMRFRRLRGLPVLSRSAATTQLRERMGDLDGQYLVGRENRHVGTVTRPLYIIDLERAMESGLDTPSRIAMISVRPSG